MICECPLGTALPNVGNQDCPERIGQIQKLAFQRIYNTNGTLNGFQMPDDDPKLLATWTEAIAATDAKKIVVTPYIQAPTTEPGAPITYGGGNDTLGGIEEIIGREGTAFTANFNNVSQSIIAQLKKLQCENIGVWMFDQNGAILGRVSVASGTDKYMPIPIQSFFIGDKTLGGLEAPDQNQIQFELKPGWSDDVTIIIPEFNPLTDLRNPA